MRASLIPDFLFGKASGGRSGGPVIEKPCPHRLTGVYSFVNVGSAGAWRRVKQLSGGCPDQVCSATVPRKLSISLVSPHLQAWAEGPAGVT